MCRCGALHVGANKPNNQTQPLYLSTTHSLFPSISRLCPFSVIDAMPSYCCTWAAHMPLHIHFAYSALTHTSSQHLCWSTWVMHVPHHQCLHVHVCVQHSCPQSLAVTHRHSSQHSQHLLTHVHTRTQTCLAFHTSILVFVCWFTHINLRTSGMGLHST